MLVLAGLAVCLLFAGKISFGYVWGQAVVGSATIWALINVMSQKGGIDLYRTSSILGYGLIPIVLLAFVGIFVSLKCTFGLIAAMGAVFWATATTSRFFATAIA